MASADLELQGAIVARLKADTSLDALVGGRIYDQPRADAPYPQVTIGEADTLRNDAECISGEDVYVTLHAWSRAVGYPEAKTVVGAVVASLHNAELSLPTFDALAMEHRQTRVFRDPDGITSHAVIEFVASTYTTAN